MSWSELAWEFMKPLDRQSAMRVGVAMSDLRVARDVREVLLQAACKVRANINEESGWFFWPCDGDDDFFDVEERSTFRKAVYDVMRRKRRKKRKAKSRVVE